MRVCALLALAWLAACSRAEAGPARFAVRGRWPGEPRLVYRLEPENGALAPEVFARSVRAALATWSATGIVHSAEAEDTDETALVFAWKRGAHADCTPFGTDPSVAHAGPVGPGSFVHFDAERTWSAATLEQAALHEIGHVLGLDHSCDEGAVMHAQPGPERARLARADLAGIHSLYGGGVGAPGDLVIRSEGDDSELVLRAVAPSGTVAWAALDTDGDGDAEIVTWRTDAGGHGATWRYHFERGPHGSGRVLERVVGPLYGVVPQGGGLGAEGSADLDGDGSPERIWRRD